MIPKDIYSQERWLAFLFLTLVGMSFLWGGCGKKGPPRPPQRRSPPAVKDLSYVIYGEMVELRWTIPGADGQKASSPAAVKVLRSRLTAEEASCENCPVRYSVSGDIPIHQKRSEKSKPKKMSYAEYVEPGYRYVYKVIVLDEYGISSKDSNIVNIDQ